MIPPGLFVSVIARRPFLPPLVFWLLDGSWRSRRFVACVSLRFIGWAGELVFWQEQQLDRS